MALSYLPCCQPRRPTARAVSSSDPQRTSGRSIVACRELGSVDSKDFPFGSQQVARMSTCDMRDEETRISRCSSGLRY